MNARHKAGEETMHGRERRNVAMTVAQGADGRAVDNEYAKMVLLGEMPHPVQGLPAAARLLRTVAARRKTG